MADPEAITDECRGFDGQLSTGGYTPDQVAHLRRCNAAEMAPNLDGIYTKAEIRELQTLHNQTCFRAKDGSNLVVDGTIGGAYSNTRHAMEQFAQTYQTSTGQKLDISDPPSYLSALRSAVNKGEYSSACGGLVK